MNIIITCMYQQCTRFSIQYLLADVSSYLYYETLMKLKECLSRKRYPLDRKILQKACKMNPTSRTICLLDHFSKLPCALHFYTPLTVSSERVFDILKSYGIPETEITVDWTETMISSLLHIQRKENGTLDEQYEVVFRKYCCLVSVVRPDGYIEETAKAITPHLKNILFACILFGKATETKAIIICDKNLLNSKNEEGLTPIMFAAKKNQREITLLLAGEKPDISIASNDGTLLIDLIHDWKDVLQELMKVCEIIRI